MLLATIYSELSLFIEMRCCIVCTYLLLQKHSLQDWGCVIRPIMSIQRKWNRSEYGAAWRVFHNNTSKVRYAPRLHSSTFLSPNIATVHRNACTYTSLQDYVYQTLLTTSVNEQWWQNSFHTDGQLPMICNRVVSAQMVSWNHWSVSITIDIPTQREWEGLGKLHT